MFLPVVQELRRLRPTWRVTVFTTSLCAPLFQPWLNAGDIWVEDRDVLHKSWRRPGVLLKWLWRVRKLRPDAALLSFDQSSVARFLAVASGARVRIGGAESAVSWRRGLTEEIAIRDGQSLAEWDWEMARSLGSALDPAWPAKPPPPKLAVNRSSSRTSRPQVLIHPGASRAYQFWPTERYVNLAERLAEGCDVTWVLYPGGPSLVPRAPVRSVSPANLSEFTSRGLIGSLCRQPLRSIPHRVHRRRAPRA